MAGTTINPYRFGGQLGYRRDGPNRLYIRERHIETSRGQWLSRDPVPIATAEFNFYWYVKNSPLIWVDPSGDGPILVSHAQKKPICPPGYKIATITGYGDCAGCKGHCSTCYVAYRKECGCRLPQSGDCANDQHKPVCGRGQHVDIIKHDGSHTSCRVCDNGQGHGGLDLKVPGPDTVSNIDIYWKTGNYCVKCSG